MLDARDISDARANLRPVPEPAVAQHHLYDRFPEQEKIDVVASITTPTGGQTLQRLCKQCNVFTGKLTGGVQGDTHCDLRSCKAPLVDFAGIPGLARVVTGRLDGAVYAVAVPLLWNRRLLMYLHGTRPLGAPVVAELDLHGDVFKWLLEDGWMVAATSYKAHGLALTEALEDTLALRAHIPSLVGSVPSMVLLEGHSLGGLVAVLLAERHPELFSACVGISAPFINARLDIPQNRGAHRQAYGNEAKSSHELEPITHRPRAPLLLLVNLSEMSPAVRYAKQVWQHHDEGDEEVLVPAVWIIKRAGHVAVNAAERLNALLHAVSWAKFGSFGSCRGRPPVGDEAFWNEVPAIKPNKQPTQGPSPSPVTCRLTKRGHGEVTKLRHTGGFVVSITWDVMESIGVRLGGRFRLTIGDGVHAPPFHVLVCTLSEYPNSGVEDFEWFGNFEAEHEWLNMCLKTFEFCNGARALGIKVGTPVVVDVEGHAASKSTRPRVVDKLARLREPGGVLAGSARGGSSRRGGKGKGKGGGKVWIARTVGGVV
eukprot:TRINITY_DN40499_c0_g1_i1.p1 TRINITY_DN40499_c0_g1~~TRINITY_DN40499_c0_g1_i1.p1  ORF type:complete len:540 (-),score=65.75 TRINITY_DN40499_c0_g1_i1:206-1825(-)